MSLDSGSKLPSSPRSALVCKKTFASVLAYLYQESRIAFDVETSGLRPHKGDRMFSMVLAASCGVFYFNFEDYEGLHPDLLLDTPEHWYALKELFKQEKTWFAHNSKFDLAFLRKEGIEVGGTIHDTKTCARLLWNDHLRYSLKDCVKRDIDMEKSDIVEKYVMEQKLYEDVKGEYATQKERYMRYQEVPFDIMAAYTLQDGNVTFSLGMHQLERIQAEDDSRPYGVSPISKVADLERQLVRPMFDMEWTGIKIDRDFCKRALVQELRIQQEAQDEFKRLTGRDYLDSPKLFKEVFQGVDVPKTEKGNASFDKRSLELLGENPIAVAITKSRRAKGQYNYFAGFLHHSDQDGTLHPVFLADGTRSGRFSSQSPNLQNLTKPDEDAREDDGEESFEVRGAFVPRDGFSFYICDYKSQEHRLLVDLAGAEELARQISAGTDVHAETAKKAGTTRHQAKIILFSTLYGSGVKRIAEQLKCSEAQAKSLRTNILDASPEIKNFMRQVVRKAESTKTARSWLGRIYRFPEKKDCYRAPNYVIQGGSADITKRAIVNCYNFLAGYKSRMVLTVHDSIVFEIAHGEEHIMSELKRIMIEAYPGSYLQMDVSVEHAPKNMGETIKVEV